MSNVMDAERVSGHAIEITRIVRVITKTAADFVPKTIFLSLLTARIAARFNGIRDVTLVMELVVILHHVHAPPCFPAVRLGRGKPGQNITA